MRRREPTFEPVVTQRTFTSAESGHPCRRNSEQRQWRSSVDISAPSRVKVEGQGVYLDTDRQLWYIHNSSVIVVGTDNLYVAWNLQPCNYKYRVRQVQVVVACSLSFGEEDASTFTGGSLTRILCHRYIFFFRFHNPQSSSVEPGKCPILCNKPCSAFSTWLGCPAQIIGAWKATITNQTHSQRNRINSERHDLVYDLSKKLGQGVLQVGHCYCS